MEIWTLEQASIDEVLVDKDLIQLSTRSTDDEADSLAHIRINRPYIKEHLDGEKIHSDFRPSFEQNRYFTMRLVFELTVPYANTRIEMVNFSVKLVGRPANPIVYDMQPQMMYVDGNQTWKFGMGSKLGIGNMLEFVSLEFGVEKTLPTKHNLVSVGGLNTSEASWRYHSVPGHRLDGLRVMLLTVECPRATSSAIAFLDLEADIVHEDRRFLVKIDNKNITERQETTVRLF